MSEKAVIAWSSGKDCAWAVHAMRQSGELELVGALTTLTREYERVSMHGVRERLLDLQMQALGLSCTKVFIPAPCPNEVYAQKMSEALEDLREQGVTTVAFGDLFLPDVRAYREEQMDKVGMRCAFPLWQSDTAALSRTMVASGLRAWLSCVDPRVLDADFAGRPYDAALLDALPPGVDPCGENGEFHTVVTAGPMFAAPIDVRVGEVVERDGFVFADVIPS